jgi:hypothetical protein
MISAQIVYFLLFWNKHRPVKTGLFAVQIATVVLFTPWIPTFLGRVSKLSQGFWIPTPGLGTILETLRVYAAGSTDSHSAKLVFAACCMLSVAGMFPLQSLSPRWRWTWPLKSHGMPGSHNSAGRREKTLLLLIWLTFPILIPFTLSQFSTPIYLARYTIGASPAFYLLVAKGMRGFSRRIIFALLLVAVGLSLLSVLRHYYAGPLKKEWREAAQFIEDHAEGTDVIVVLADTQDRKPFDYYYRGTLKRDFIVFGAGDKIEDQIRRIHELLGGSERVWLALAPDAEPAFIRTLEDYFVHTFGYVSLLKEKKWGGITLYCFAVRISHNVVVESNSQTEWRH